MEIIRNHTSYTNVHPTERLLSVLAGGILAVSAIRSSTKTSGILRAAIAAGMIKRGVTGRCAIYKTFGVRTVPSDSTIPYELGIRARAAVTVQESRDKVFQFWRQLENLPKFMRHLISVQEIDGGRSHWVAEGPAGERVQWDAEIINEIPNELLAWKSLPGSDVDSAGSVRFGDAPGGRGTEIRVELQYNPPAGIVGAYVARLMGREPEQEIQGDLNRLKQFLEGGEVTTSHGPHGPHADSSLVPSLDEVIA